MNVINISEEMMKKINGEVSKRVLAFQTHDIFEFAFSLENLTFDNYYIKIGERNTFDYIININSPFQELYPELYQEQLEHEFSLCKENSLKIERYVIGFKTITLLNNVGIGESGAFSFDFSPFVAKTTDNKCLLDFFIRASEEAEKHFTSDQIYDQVECGMYLLISLEKRFKKEQRRIKKKMPTPEQVQQIATKNQYYKSEPIGIGNISIQYVYDPHQARSYSRHCECWGVKGHYRHYKNGKKVYIKPYTKGKGTPKVTDYYFEKYFED